MDTGRKEQTKGTKVSTLLSSSRNPDSTMQIRNKLVSQFVQSKCTVIKGCSLSYFWCKIRLIKDKDSFFHSLLYPCLLGLPIIMELTLRFAS